MSNGNQLYLRSNKCSLKILCIFLKIYLCIYAREYIYSFLFGFKHVHNDYNFSKEYALIIIHDRLKMMVFKSRSVEDRLFDDDYIYIK